VDEVDAFLQRVEATIAGEPIEAPVTAQEVHDVVFRVRFGGYDEWQVDLHLDRVERQLAEMAERAPSYGRVPDPRAPGRPTPSPLPHRPSPVPGGGMAPGGMAGAGAGGGMAGAQPEAGPGPRYDEPTYAGGYDRTDTFHQDMTTEMHVGDPGGPQWSPPGPPPGMGGGPHAGPGGQQVAGPPSMSGPPTMAGPPTLGGPPPGMGAPATGGFPAGELQRLDELRRGFQPRRFGSGYDRTQVDQLFEQVLAGMSGRAPMSVTETQLDPRRFDLVPGGYYEADVDNALREVREILRRH
jgi:DivIVA domain-containing protein